MGLYKRGQVWWMRFNHHGALIRKSTDTQDRKLAERIYHSVRGKIAEGKWFDRPEGEDRTFRELMERYVREHTDRNKAVSSHRRDRGMAERLNEEFGDMKVTAITPRLIVGYKSKRHGDGPLQSRRIDPETANGQGGH
jgi:hypothetical protein